MLQICGLIILKACRKKTFTNAWARAGGVRTADRLKSATCALPGTEPAGYALDVAVDLAPSEMLTLPCYAVWQVAADLLFRTMDQPL